MRRWYKWLVKTPSHLDKRRGPDSRPDVGYLHHGRTCCNYLTWLSLTGGAGTSFVLFPFLPLSGRGGRWKDGMMGRSAYSHRDRKNGWMEANVLAGWRRQRRSVGLLLGMPISHCPRL